MILLSSIDPKERTSYTDIDNRFSSTVSSGTFPDIPETHSFMNHDFNLQHVIQSVIKVFVGECNLVSIWLKTHYVCPKC